MAEQPRYLQHTAFGAALAKQQTLRQSPVSEQVHETILGPAVADNGAIVGAGVSAAAHADLNADENADDRPEELVPGDMLELLSDAGDGLPQLNVFSRPPIASTASSKPTDRLPQRLVYGENPPPHDAHFAPGHVEVTNTSQHPVLLLGDRYVPRECGVYYFELEADSMARVVIGYAALAVLNNLSTTSSSSSPSSLPGSMPAAASAAAASAGASDDTAQFDDLSDDDHVALIAAQRPPIRSRLGITEIPQAVEYSSQGLSRLGQPKPSRQAKLWQWSAGRGNLTGWRAPASVSASVPEYTRRIGIILDFARNQIRLTQDGALLDASCWIDVNRALSTSEELFPLVQIAGTKARVIFGNGKIANDGFRFDVASYVRAAQREVLAETLAVPLPDGVDMSALLDEYFRFYGYAGVLGEAVTPEVLLRQQVRQLIEAGDIASVIPVLQSSTQVLAADAELAFDLQLQHFIQLASSTDLDEPRLQAAISIGQELASAITTAQDMPTRSLPADAEARLRRASALLFVNPTAAAADDELATLTSSETLSRLAERVLTSMAGGNLPRLRAWSRATQHALAVRAAKGRGKSSLASAYLTQLGLN